MSAALVSLTWDWRGAACRGHDPAIWDLLRFAHRAKEICATCPVTSRCLEAVLATEDPGLRRHGTWAGMTEHDRRVKYDGWPASDNLCAKGLHELVGDNLLMDGRSQRCRQCRTESRRKANANYRAKMREAVPA